MRIVRKSLPKNIHLFILLLFLIQSCCNTSTHSVIQSAIQNNNYLGEWYSVERITPFGATLRIDSNYTFNYEGGACVMHFGSKGIWRLNEDTLILNSIEPEECYYLFEFNPVCFDLTDSFIYLKTRTTKEGLPPINYEYVLFKDVKFLIIDSVLTHIPLCPQVKNDFIRTKEWF